LEVKPFLKWVGGKRKLIPQLEAKFPDYIKSNEFTYVEPFLGGGAMFFHLVANYKLKKIYLNDLNDKLIDCYQNVRDHSDKLIKQLKKLEKDYYSSSDKKLFYLDRREEFNNLKLSINKSALLIFLNKTGFNGMYRENSKGEYNIPVGSMNNPLICDEDLIQNISNVLNNNDIKFSSKSFEELIINEKNIFYYLDPPYMPISKTSSFTDYTSKNIYKNDIDLQNKICEYCSKIDLSDSFFLQSNSYLPDFFKHTYDNKYFFDKLEVTRTIGADGSKRNKIHEILIGNF
tara:strand:+ start:280 stop:1143 length:864 start_codon:yes stop_codon:yes gene_type:complete